MERLLLQLEFARSIRDGVKSMLWEHLLPRLLAEGSAQPALWTRFAEAATDFELEMAPLRGVPVTDHGGGRGELLPPLATSDGCLTVVYNVRLTARLSGLPMHHIAAAGSTRGGPCTKDRAVHRFSRVRAEICSCGTS